MDPYIGEYVDLNDVKYWFEAKNHESQIQPALLFIHGFSGNRTRLNVIWDYFDELNYPIYRIDLKGHGQSQKEEIATYSFDSCAQEIKDFIETIIIEQDGHNKITLLAHSMGVFIAQIIAISHPEYLSNLIIISGVPRVTRKYYRLLTFADKFYPLIMRFLFRRRRKDHENLGLEYFPEWLPGNEHLRPDNDALKAYMNEMRNTDLTDKLDKIEIPTLIFSGSEDDFATPELVKEMRDKIQGSKLKIFPETGHFPYLDYPIDICEEILSLIRKS